MEFRAKLNQTSTREEAIPIFKEAVVELDKYGLLPKGMDIRHAQELVTGGFLNQKSLDMLKTFSFRNPTVRNNSNYLCLITGHLSIVFFFPAIVHLVLMSLLYFAEYLLEYYTAAGLIAFIAKLILLGLYYLIPQIVGSLRFSINNFIFTTESGEHSPTDGWLNTVGLLGIKKWNGTIIGSLPFNLLPHNLLAAGFTGFKLRTEGTEYGFEFIGNALAVSVENES